MTRTVGSFGCPIGRSLSPVMHNAAFKAAGHDWDYVAVQVRLGDLAVALSGIRVTGWASVNLTIPHKERAVRFLDRVSKEARSVGAVNTAVCGSQGMVGPDTDGRGFLTALGAGWGFDPKEKRVAPLGARGGICVKPLSDAAGEITILNRTPLLASASRLRVGVQGGLGMLLHRGAEVFKPWTGEPPPIEVMRWALRRELSKISPP
jgi:shikimate dehydrogenase